MSSYDASTDRGCHANIHWRAVAESDLSQHPLYRSLGAVNKGETSDPRMIPQHSVQWEELHYGRLTTSKLASILGFYEQDIAEFLGIPRSLRGHHRVVEGWQQLRANPITTTSQTTSSSSSNAFKIETPWKPSDSCKFPFAYCPNSCPPCGPKGLNDATLARLHWGSAQESTAILCAVNYLSSLDSSLVVAEAGMQVFELLADPPSSLERMVKEWQDNKEFPLLGASPDGLIYNSTGQLVSVLEAKCTSPFVASTRPGSFLQVQKSRPHEELLPVWHIPQLQLEMFCAGSSCRSAVVVVLAVDSAKIIKVHRDDEYIREMLLWSRDFYVRFIASVPRNRMKPPPPHFLSQQMKRSADVMSAPYIHFLRASQRLAASAETMVVLSNDQIQRHPALSSFFLDGTDIIAWGGGSPPSAPPTPMTMKDDLLDEILTLFGDQ